MDTARPTAEAPSPLDALRLLRSSGGALLEQAQLHGQLAQVEWQEQKRRLLRMLAVLLLGFASLLCALLAASGAIVVAGFQAGQPFATLVALASLFGIGTAVAWRRLRALAAQAGEAFAATREELAADAELLKGSL